MIRKMHLILTTMAMVSSFTLLSQNCLTLYAESQMAAPEAQVCLDVKVKGFNNILGFQFSMKYDPQKLSFISFDGTGLENINYAHLASDNQINLAWISNTLIPESLSEGDVLFTTCFDVVGTDGDATRLNLGDGSLMNEFIDDNEQVISASFINPNIYISSSGSGSDLSISNTCISYLDCAGLSGDFSFDVSGGQPPYTYQWTGSNGYSSTADNALNLEVGDYVLQVTDQSDISIFVNFSLEEGNLAAGVLPHLNNPDCNNPNGGSIQLTTASGAPLEGYNIVWSTGETGEEISNLPAGTYTATVTSISGECEEVKAFELVMETIFEATGNCYFSGGDLIGEVQIEAVCGLTPPLTVQWSDGTTELVDGTTATLVIVNPDSNTAYGATVIDSEGTIATSNGVFFNGCQHSFEVNAQVFNLDCAGDAGAIYIAVTPPSNDYTYQWSNGDMTPVITNLDAGIYTVTVTDNQTGEQITKSYEVLEFDGLHVASNYGCTDQDAADLYVISWNGTAPYIFEWSTGEVDTTTEIYSNIHVLNGNYNVTVTDANGCSGTLENILISCGDYISIDITPNSGYYSSGDEVCFDFSVSDFADIAAMQFTIQWDPALMGFTSMNDFNLPGLSQSNFGLFPEEGFITFAWVQPQGAGLTVDDGTTIFSLCFEAQNTGIGSLDITAHPTAIEVVRPDGSILGINTNSATYSVGAQSGLAVVGIDTKAGMQGEEVCLDVYGKDIHALIAAQFSINWNPEELELIYLDANNSVLSGLNSSNFEINSSIGVMPFSWVDPSLSGININEGDILFSLCFNPLIADGFATVSFSNTSIPIEFIDSNEEDITPQLLSGGVSISDGLVWPGDADANGIVNQYDLLNIGFAFGNTGDARAGASDNWIGQSANSWNGETPQTHINFKYADCDGNGIVDTPDRDVILSNWKETNELWEGDINAFNHTPISALTLSTNPLFVDAHDVEEGEEAVFDLVLGSESEVENLYGLAFVVRYDPAAVVSGSLGISFDNSWFGTEGEDFIAIYKNDAENGRIAIGMTRIDGNPISGAGAIAQLSITIEDVIFRDDYLMFFDVQNIRALNEQEQELLIAGQQSRASVSPRVATNTTDWGRQIVVFPNPVTGVLNIQSRGLTINSFDILNIEGLRIKSVENPTVDMRSFAPGIYFLRINSSKGVLYKKIIKQ